MRGIFAVGFGLFLGCQNVDTGSSPGRDAGDPPEDAAASAMGADAVSGTPMADAGPGAAALDAGPDGGAGPRPVSFVPVNALVRAHHTVLPGRFWVHDYWSDGADNVLHAELRAPTTYQGTRLLPGHYLIRQRGAGSFEPMRLCAERSECRLFALDDGYAVFATGGIVFSTDGEIAVPAGESRLVRLNADGSLRFEKPMRGPRFQGVTWGQTMNTARYLALGSGEELFIGSYQDELWYDQVRYATSVGGVAGFSEHLFVLHLAAASGDYLGHQSAFGPAASGVTRARRLAGGTVLMQGLLVGYGEALSVNLHAAGGEDRFVYLSSDDDPVNSPWLGLYDARARRFSATYSLDLHGGDAVSEALPAGLGVAMGTGISSYPARLRAGEAMRRLPARSSAAFGRVAGDTLFAWTTLMSGPRGETLGLRGRADGVDILVSAGSQDTVVAPGTPAERRFTVADPLVPVADVSVVTSSIDGRFEATHPMFRLVGHFAAPRAVFEPERLCVAFSVWTNDDAVAQVLGADGHERFRATSGALCLMCVQAEAP